MSCNVGALKTAVWCSQMVRVKVRARAREWNVPSIFHAPGRESLVEISGD